MTKLIQHIELVTGENPKGSIIWLHGLGADCWDFVSIVKELGLPDDLPLRFIFPQAPSRPIAINNGQVMPGWYDISMAELQRKPDEAGVRQSQAMIEQLIAREIERGIAADKIILAGFSQGGAIALQTGLRYAKELGGIMALSTYLTLEDSFATEATTANAKYAPANGASIRLRVLDAKLGPSTAPNKPPAMTSEIAFSLNPGAANSAAAKRYNCALAL